MFPKQLYVFCKFTARIFLGRGVGKVVKVKQNLKYRFYDSVLPLYIDVNVMLCILFTLLFFLSTFFISLLICLIYITTFNLLCYSQFTTCINPIDVSKYEYFKIKLTLIKYEIQSFWVFQTASCFDFHV